MRRTKGHRAMFTRVRITDILSKGLVRCSVLAASQHQATRHQLLRIKQWLIKKDKAAHATAATRNSQRLGVKAHDGNVVTGGTIIVRQRGRRFRPGLNAGLGKDDTIFAKVDGRVRFEDHGARGRVISILPVE